MARGTELSVVRDMLKSECGEALYASTEIDAELNQLIASKQHWLFSQYDWSFLQHRWDASCSSQFTAFPTTTKDGTAYTLDFDRKPKVEVYFNNVWLPLDYGIGQEEYTSYDSYASEKADPIQRWAFHDAAQFEVWPLPITTQTVRFTGQRRLTSLKNDALEWDDGLTLDLDDLLVVYHCAAERLLRRNQRDAIAKAELARDRLRTLRAMYPTRTLRVVLGGEDYDKEKIKLVGIASST